MNNIHNAREISVTNLACKAHLSGLHPQVVPPLSFCTAFLCLWFARWHRQHQLQTCRALLPRTDTVIHKRLFEEIGWLSWTELKGTALLQIYTSGTGTRLRNSRLKNIKAWFCKAKGLHPVRTVAWHGMARKKQSPRAAACHRAKENSCVSPISSALVALMSHLVCNTQPFLAAASSAAMLSATSTTTVIITNKEKSGNSWLANLTLPFPFHRPTNQPTHT